MLCPFCSRDIPINKEYCPYCGKRVNVGFDQIAGSIHDEAAVRRGEQIETYLKWLVVAVAILGVLAISLNDLWDRPVLYSGADLPSLEPPDAELTSPGTIAQPYRELQPVPEPVPPPPRVFGYRFDPIRSRLRDLHGGDAATAEAVRRGLKYLATSQDQNGSWAVDASRLRIQRDKDQSAEYRWGRVGLSALALLAFLGDGQVWTSVPEGHENPYGANAQRAVNYLLEQQDAETGRFGKPEGHFMFNHALASFALAEAAGMTGEARLREAAQKGVRLLQNAQGDTGGWGYTDAATVRKDTSVTVWAVQALAAAREAGLEVDPQAFEKAAKFLSDVVTPKTAAVLYGIPGKQTQASYTGAVLMARQRLGEQPSTGIINRLARRTLGGLPRKPRTSPRKEGMDWEDKGADFDRERALYFDPHQWYFDSYGLFFFGGEEWNEWNAALKNALTGPGSMQDRDGAYRANDIWTSKAGPAYSTSLCVMMLEAYYRMH